MFNMYTFSRNDPINFIDVNGNAPWWHWYGLFLRHKTGLNRLYRLVDVVLAAVGFAVSLVPIPGLAYLGGAIMGAGINGFMYDLSAGKAANSKDWGIQLGIGAAFGLVTAGAGEALDAAIPAASIADYAAARGVTGAFELTEVSGLVGRTALRAAIRTGAESANGVLKQLANNAIAGRSLDEGLGYSAVMGALSGIASSGTSSLSQFLPSVM